MKLIINPDQEELIRNYVSELNVVAPFNILGLKVWSFDADKIVSTMKSFLEAREGSEDDQFRAVFEIEGVVSKPSKDEQYGMKKFNNFPPIYGGVTDWPAKANSTGITVIVGGAGAGKTRLFAEQLQPQVILRIGEPYESTVEGNVEIESISVPDVDTLLVFVIVLSSMGITYAIDSLREFAYNMEGAATARGLKAQLFTSLTSLNNFVSFLGFNAPVALNPMGDDETIRYAYEAAAGSVAGAVLLKSGEIVESLIRRENERSPVASSDVIYPKPGYLSDDGIDRPRGVVLSVADDIIAKDNENEYSDRRVAPIIQS